MDHREQCRQAARALKSAGGRRPSTLVGFDGFIDQIVDVVGRRYDPARYEAISTIAEFGARVSRAAGMSSNFELVVKQTKIGGNGPIMANALLGYGHRITYVGVVGEREVHPVFAPLARGAEALHLLGPPAGTDALEFRDGKLMLGKLVPMAAVSYRRLLDCVGEENLRELLGRSDVVATVNWTMSLGMTEIWRRLAEEVLPGLRGDRPLWFVDLADPAKRSPEDLLAALEALRGLQLHADVVLGMNGSEGQQVLSAFGRRWRGGLDDADSAQRCCEELRAELGISRTVVHLVASAACCWEGGSVQAQGFYCADPVITTGAGDHFNAGFLAALSAGLEARDCLLVGGGTSSLYVRSGATPSQDQVAEFLSTWSAP